jgi:hypothetical protein
LLFSILKYFNSIAIANAVGKAMVPYFGRIMEHLKIYLSGQLTEEEMPLQIQALGKYSTVSLIIFPFNKIFC